MDAAPPPEPAHSALALGPRPPAPPTPDAGPLFSGARLWSPGLRISAKASCAAEHARRAVGTG